MHETVMRSLAPYEFRNLFAIDCDYVYALGPNSSAVRIAKPKKSLAYDGQPCTAPSDCQGHMCLATSCDGPGTCTSATYQWCQPKSVCGCDKLIYANPCDALDSGNLAYTEGACKR
jgi:hypothetical protein